MFCPGEVRLKRETGKSQMNGGCAEGCALLQTDLISAVRVKVQTTPVCAQVSGVLCWRFRLHINRASHLNCQPLTHPPTHPHPSTSPPPIKYWPTAVCLTPANGSASSSAKGTRANPQRFLLHALLHAKNKVGVCFAIREGKTDFTENSKITFRYDAWISDLRL